MEGHHYFFALLLPQHIKSYLHEKCEQIKMEFPFKKWVHHEDYHITLAFLGHAQEEQLEKADMYVKDVLSHSEGFELALHKLGVFGRQDSPRIFWANTKESQQLTDIRKLVYDSCTKAGFKLDPRHFAPHITLARNWEGKDRFSLEALKPFALEEIIFTAKHVVLYETHLNKTPKYVIKKTYLLC
ncbi:RNA 2',3'-cyclic phosphodiesterase [Heyndrickxia camelliae]|uniref:RNA 2',3'-cyclic phosphodiesterase n=1 Tax=Heyndrickxia camelliae TaxID=1707093 RepID=A0A2N3LIH9_9BACI|nr:RNA 2',3'-cyclic phosphodiesterase [Heyndrickxia camelliae]PKR84349.1 RNA 2',3'-cyclic phosphodiesterase [Heyndrickxia camelliae]